MEIVLVDKFIVPDESKARFLEEVHKSASFLRTLPGFVEVSLANCNFRKPQGMSQSKMNSSSTGVPSGGLRLHTQGGWDFCLYQRRFGAAPKAVSHSRLLADISRSGHRWAKPNNSLRRRQPCRSVSDFWCVPATTFSKVQLPPGGTHPENLRSPFE